MLNEKYRPKDMILGVMQKRELNALTLKAREDPDKFGTNIVCLEIEHKHKLSEEDKVAALVGVAGPKYANNIFWRNTIDWKQGRRGHVWGASYSVPRNLEDEQSRKDYWN